VTLWQIADRLIAMALPCAAGAAYRNDIRQVAPPLLPSILRPGANIRVPGLGLGDARLGRRLSCWFFWSVSLGIKSVILGIIDFCRLQTQVFEPNRFNTESDTFGTKGWLQWPCHALLAQPLPNSSKSLHRLKS